MPMTEVFRAPNWSLQEELGQAMGRLGAADQSNTTSRLALARE